MRDDCKTSARRDSTVTTVFGEYAEVYSAIYSDKDYAQEADYLAKLFRKYGVGPASSLLEFGAGIGQLAIELAEIGYEVTAMDLSPEMVSHSLDGANVQVGDIRSFETDYTVNGVVAFFHVLSYLRTDDDLSRGFKTVASLLDTGGIFIADFWFGPAVRNLEPEIRVKQVSNNQVEVFRLAEPEWNQEKNWVDVVFTGFFRRFGESNYKKFQEKHCMRYFDQDELAHLASAEGMSLVHLEETLTGNPPSDMTWGVTAVFKKV